MQKTYTEADLIGFIDYLAKKNLMKGATAQSRKIAALKVLSALDDHEKLDLRNVDRDHAYQRFVNKLGNDFTPGSLLTYRSRFNSALDDFIHYQADPGTFKSGSKQRRSHKSKESANLPKKKAGKAVKPRGEVDIPPPTSNSFDCKIPLRDGVVVQIHNLPNDLTVAEALRISSIVNAYAIPGMENTKT